MAEVKSFRAEPDEVQPENHVQVPNVGQRAEEVLAGNPDELDGHLQSHSRSDQGYEEREAESFRSGRGMPSRWRFGLILLWVLAGSLQYGFHISALNSVQDSIVCAPSSPPRRGANGLPSCVEMSTFSFGVVTAAFTLGGFVASVNGGRLADHFGRKLAAVYSAGLVAIGGIAMSTGSSLTVLVFGRFIIGLACGISTVLVPLFLSEIAPPAIKGSVGVLTQLSICCGIFLAQVISVPLSTAGTGNWRHVPLVSACIGIAQIFTGPIMIESPKWQADRTSASQRRGATADEEAPLARDLEDGDETDLGVGTSQSRPSLSRADQEDSLTLWEALTTKDANVWHGLKTVVLCQAFQQGSGINAVMYYSTGILSAVSPQNAKYVTLFVTFVNVLMTLPAVYLIDRLGRRLLLLLSLGTMAFSSLILAYSINHLMFLLAAVFIVAFVASFSVGLGPIPFLLLGEVPPPQARAASASAALAANWSLNFLIGLSFLPLRNWVSGGKQDGEGTIFYLFAIVSSIGFATIWRLMR